MGDLSRAVAIVAVGAIMPDAPNASAFWENIKQGRYSISEVDPSRWDPHLYYDPDPKAPDKTYSKIGGWVRDWEWEPRAWKLALMPTVADQMDDTQKWAVACTQQALTDYGYPERPLDNDRVAVVFGNAMAGEQHYKTATRIAFPEFAEDLGEAPSFRALPADVQRAIAAEFGDLVAKRYPEITEDTMPGELSNCIAGRVANLFNFRGPNYVVDAACASAMAAMNSAVSGLVEGEYDAVITGGIDRNMGPTTFVKFSKIGALSATGTRPYAAGADGFVMGEGAATFLLKRLGDAVRDGDHIYCVLLAMAGSSDGKGKGITAPNPVGQKLSVERAWHKAGVAPQTATLVEGHGTSTRVGDVVEHASMAAVFGGDGVAVGSIALGSVKSNIGHLKAGAGAAGIFKVVMAIHDKVLPPSLNFSAPNPDIDFANSPFRVNTELRDWELPEAGVRRAGVSAFGFGGTNFHTVLEEYVPAPGDGGARSFAVPEVKATVHAAAAADVPARRAAVVGAENETQLGERLADLLEDAVAGRLPSVAPPEPETLAAPERVAIDYGTAEELADKVKKAQQALTSGEAAWKMLQARGIFRGRGPRQKIAFLYTGQGSQYPNMLRALAESDPIVAEVFDEADRVMTPMLGGRTLRDFLFVDPDDPSALAQASEDLRRTEITQPSVLTVDYAITRMLDERGFHPDFVMGHSLGEYGALVAAGALPFADALEAVSARGREMASLDLEDKGLMAAVFAPLTEVEQIVASIDGNVVIANINSSKQVVIGGASIPVQQAMAALAAAGHQVVQLPVSHAFHTSIVAPASVPLEKTLARLHLCPPQIPVVANLSGDFYPMGPGVEAEMVSILGRQVASPVQFVKGLRTLYEHGARVFVEVGPKKALHGFAEEMFGDDPSVLSLFTNHPKWADAVAFNQALCGLYASGVAPGVAISPEMTPAPSAHDAHPAKVVATRAEASVSGWAAGPSPRRPVVVTGAALGLPGMERVFDEGNLGRLLGGQGCIGPIPAAIRNDMLDQHITRVVKQPDGSGSFVSIDDAADVIKLAGRAGAFDPVAEFGIDPDRVLALENSTCMAIAAGLDALRDAGIPLVQHYKTTHIGTRLPERWGLPDELRDDTGVIFAAAFPGLDAFAGYSHDYYLDKGRRQELAALEGVRALATSDNGSGVNAVTAELDRRISALRAEIDEHPYAFDRRFLFRVLSMGHSQFAEFIGARGPNTQVNAACASTTQAVTVAEDWIRSGRCRRVIVVGADDATSDNLLGWIGSGFLASGAAATDAEVEDAATPFDLRRHGMIIGMGAVALVVEAAEAAEERGIRPIAELMSGVTANSAFHGTRLDVEHISGEMEQLLLQAEQRWGLDRKEMAPETLFVSHETYTPARGGSAAAEIASLRAVFGSSADEIVIANTKGFTGHAMGAGIEDVLAVKSLETGLVPPIPNFKEADPGLGELNLSHGGSYPVQYAIRLAAGFGSQISLTLLRRVPAPDGQRHAPDALGYEYRIDDAERWDAWLARVSGQAGATVNVVQHQLRVVASPPAAANLVEAASPTVQHDAPALDGPVHIAASESAQTTEASTDATVVGPVESVSLEAPTFEAPPVTATQSVTEDEVRQHVLALVAEKTGYPQDMLDLDLDLEADLGVDTVKQAELFASVREAYGIVRDDNLKLRDYPTLQHVIGFVMERAGGPAAAAVVEAPPVETTAAPVVEAPVPPLATQSVSEDEVRQHVLALVAEKTGYPQDMLDLDLDLEADLGVDTVKQAELFASVREAYGIVRDDNLKLRDYPTLQHVIGFVMERAGGPAAVAAVVEAAPVEAPPVETTAAPVVEAPVPPLATQSVSEDEVRQHVLALVAEKTGYPQDMLDLDLDLEADLGVDTVKQAELFASVREAYGIVRDDNLKLRDYPTLQHVIGFVMERAGGPAAVAAVVEAAPVEAPPVETTAAPVVEAPVPPLATQSVSEDEVRQHVLALVAEKTGYPQDMLDLDLDLEADLGVDTVKQAELFASVREAYGIVRDDNLKLRDYPTLQHVIGFVMERAGGPAAAAVVEAPPVETTAAPVVEAPVPRVVAPVASAAATVIEDEVRQHVLALVAEKTGYPQDMLDLDLDLEADLGVDTVKQAELFASVREAYGIVRDDNLKLRDYPTLQHVIGFVMERAGGPAAAAGEPAPSVAATPSPQIALPVRDVAAGLEACDAVVRRVPVPVLRPPLDLCRRTGLQLSAGARVVVMPDHGGVSDALAGLLTERGVKVLVIDGTPTAEMLAAELAAWASSGGVQGVYWLPGLDQEPPLAQLDIASWKEHLRLRVKLLAATMRALYEEVAPPGTFLVVGTRMGGRHGYDAGGASAPMGGAVAGFAKAYKRERPNCLVKAVDLTATAAPALVASALVEETERDPGAVEIGRQDDLRWAIGLREEAVEDGRPGLELGPDSVFVVTGAAGSIVSAIIADLARASGGTFHLLDLAPEPDAADPDLEQFATDRDGLKRELYGRMKEAGERPTPALLDRALAGIERRRAALDAILAIQEAGGHAVYHSIDLRDADAVSTALSVVRASHGQVDVLLHAAGLEVSRFLGDKSDSEFDLVFDVKSDGWFNLLAALGDTPLGATVCFSSVAGRFGNGGQTDYSAANDLLCKVTSSFRTSRPETRGIVIDWTAWSGIGMATRGSIPKMMDMAGIAMLAPEAGVPWVRRELVAGGRTGEVVVAGELGILTEEPDADGGLDRPAVRLLTHGPMVGEIRTAGVFCPLIVETLLDPTAQGFLNDHRIDGLPVMPGVMSIEALAEVASLLVPAWRVTSIEDVAFLAPFKFYRDEPRQFAVEAWLMPEGDELVAHCRLLGSRTLPNLDNQITTHVTGRVRLAHNWQTGVTTAPPLAPEGASVAAEAIYKVYFHGPTYQVLGRSWRQGDRQIGLMASGLPANHQPPELPLLTAPRSLELCFQTAGVWELASTGRLGLPQAVGRVSLFEPASSVGSVYAVVEPRGEQFDAEVLDDAGVVRLRMEGYRTVALPVPIGPELLEPLRVAVS